MEKIIIEMVTNPVTGQFVVLGGILVGMMLIMLILHLSIRSRISDRIDQQIVDLMRSDDSSYLHELDRDNK